MPIKVLLVGALDVDRWVKGLSESSHPLVAGLFGLGYEHHHLSLEPYLRVLEEVRQRVFGWEDFGSARSATGAEFERLIRLTYASYLSQAKSKRHFRGALLTALRSLLAFTSLPFLLLMLLRLTWRTWRRRGVRPAGARVVCFPTNELVRQTVAEVLPGDQVLFLQDKGLYYGAVEICFVARAIRACPRLLAHPWLLLNVLRWLGHYSHAVRTQRPRVIAIGAETTPSASLLTAYLRQQGVEHYNFLHGERYLDARGAFAEFDRFYLWGEHWRQLQLAQHCPRGQLVVWGNPVHRRLFHEIRPQNQPRPKKLLVVHAFWLTPGTECYHSLLELLGYLDRSWDVAVRPHPTYRKGWKGFLETLNREPAVQKLGLVVREESPAPTPLVEALRTSRVLAAGYSTMLLEGWIAGCKVIYLQGCGEPNVFLDRHGGSVNVLHLGQRCMPGRVRDFLETEATLDAREAKLVNYVSKVN